MTPNYNFLNSSILFDKYTYPDNGEKLRNYIDVSFPKVVDFCGYKKSGKDNYLYYDSFKQILLNCVVSAITERPIAISLNNNDYATGERLKKLFFSSTHLRTVLYDLKKMGIIEIAKGGRQIKKTTRFWATEHFISKIKPLITTVPLKYQNDEMLLLRRKKQNKNSKGYSQFNDTDHAGIPQIREDLALINKIASNNTVTLECSNTVIPHTFMEFIQNKNINGEITLTTCIPTHRITHTISDDIHNNINNRENLNIKYYDYSLTKRTNKNSKESNLFITLLSNLDVSQKIQYSKNDILSSIGNQSFNLIRDKQYKDFYHIGLLSLKYCYPTTKRTFNIDFDHGGRFSSAYQLTPSYLREYIKINGEDTVEVDIKACTLQMLYHLRNVECPTDPYEKLAEIFLPKNYKYKNNPDKRGKVVVTPSLEEAEKIINTCEVFSPIHVSMPSYLTSPEPKNLFKFIQIVLANAVDKSHSGRKSNTMSAEESAIRSIANNIRENEYPHTSEFMVKKIIYKFKEIHEPIADDIFIGKGLQLQNVESKIANRVLKHFAEKNIMCLCIHDSFRIAEKYKDELITVLKKSYFDELGYEPMLTLDGESV